MGDDMIVQRYIPNPLTVDGLKFDLRIYVLITNLESPQAYICQRGLARFCTEEYKDPRADNFKDFFRHLTNYSINKHHEEYKEAYTSAEESTTNANDNSKRTLSSCLQSLATNGVDVDLVMSNVEATCKAAMEVWLPFMRQSFLGCQSEEGIKAAPVGKSFLILGLDILVDQDLKAWLLEVNDNPSLYIYLEKDFMGGGVPKEVSRVDLDVKGEVVADAIELAKRKSFPD